ncbi:Uncharacterised protein [Mycobacterium tuberculosis]|nr:Uncharacterised protein [Mycobacterium tuberculosis]
MAGEVLEHRQQPGVAQPLRERPGVGGDRLRIRAERPVADHRVVGLVGDVDDRGEVDGDAQLFHLLTTLQGQVVDLLDGLGLGQLLG